MEIRKEWNSGLPPGRGQKVFESVSIPKDRERTIPLKFSLIGHPSKIQSYAAPVSEMRPQFKVESATELMDGNFGTRILSQNANRDLSYLCRTKKDGWFVSDFIQSRERISNQVNQCSGQTHHCSKHCFNQHSNQVNQSSESFHTHSNRSDDPLSVQKCDPNSSNQDGSSGKYRNSSKGFDPKLSRDPRPSNQDGSFWDNRCRSNVLDPKLSHDSRFYNQSGFLGKYKDRSNDFGSRQDGDPGSSNQEGSQGKHWNHSNVPASSLSRDAEPSVLSETLEVCSNRSNVLSTHQLPSNQDGSCVKNTNRSLGNCTVLSRELECPNRDVPMEENKEGLVPVSNRTQSNEDASILETSSSGGSGSKKWNKKGTKKERLEAVGGRTKRTLFRYSRAFLSSGTQLKRHVDVQRRDLVLKCPICGKRYRGPDRLRDHMKVHGKKSGPHSCERCGLQFTRRVFLDRHVPNCPGRI